MMSRTLLAAFALLVVGACGGSATPPDDQVVSVFVTSGVPQPPPEDVAVRAGDPVVVQPEGLGPARVVVFAPDASRVPTTDVANGQRFTPHATGTYRVEHAEVPDLVLVNVVAR